MYSSALILLSGSIASGKTTLARNLARRLPAQHISTSGLISAMTGGHPDRAELQQLGLAAEFQGADWLISAITQSAADSSRLEIVIIDAVRTVEQVRHLYRAGAGVWRILHVHLRADDSQLSERHEMRQDEGRASWEHVMRAQSESAVQVLEAEADVVIDTTRTTPEDVTARVVARVLRMGQPSREYVDVLVGGQWGSEGKGNLAFFLAPEYDLLVRVGAPNAGHKVRTPDGLVYTHRQLPSGTLATRSQLLLGPGTLIDVKILLREIAECGVAAGRLSVDPDALVIVEADVERETGLRQAIGSTGTGGGAALARRIEQRGNPAGVLTAKNVPGLSPYIRESEAALDEARARGGRIFIEGTQGTGLSILHGSFPHVTSRDTTVGTLLAEVGIPPQLLRKVVVAFRSYPIRVGGQSGPMGREITWDVVANRSGLQADLMKETERGSVSGNPRRVAEFSWVQLRNSVRLNGATDLALTFADYLDARNRGARRVSQLTQETIDFIREMESVAAVPVSLVSAGFDGHGPIDRRLW